MRFALALLLAFSVLIPNVSRADDLSVSCRYAAERAPGYWSEGVANEKYTPPFAIQTECGKPLCVAYGFCKVGKTPPALASLFCMAIKDGAGEWKCPSADACAMSNDTEGVEFYKTLSELSNGSLGGRPSKESGRSQ